jgi:hypothetical protein
MPYTIWYCGVLIGETDFEGQGSSPHQHAGVFRPTAYGREVFPQLSGMLSVASALKDEMQEHGLDEDDMDADAVTDFLETTPTGRKILDIGRALSEVELRDPSGKALEFVSIAFMDLSELATLSRKLDCESAPDLDVLPPDAPQLIVSTTLRQ